MISAFFALIAGTVLLSSQVEGAHYTRWGKTSCNDGAVALMTGYMVGAIASSPGSGSNYVCISDTPIFENLVYGDQPWSAWVVGAQYYFVNGYTNNAPFSFANNAGQDLTLFTGTCAVCYRSDAADAITFSGINKCPNEAMNLEYKGYLVSTVYSENRTEYICLDGAPDIIKGMGQPQQTDPMQGVWLQPVQAYCKTHSFPCPPYSQGNELTCAVCSI